MLRQRSGLNRTDTEMRRTTSKRHRMAAGCGETRRPEEQRNSDAQNCNGEAALRSAMAKRGGAALGSEEQWQSGA